MERSTSDETRTAGRRAWELLAAVARPEVVASIQAEHARDVVDAVEEAVAEVGAWLLKRGHGALWTELFAHLASEEGGGVGPSSTPAPGDELRFLEAVRGEGDQC
jgi:hypothetical protein